MRFLVYWVLVLSFGATALLKSSLGETREKVLPPPEGLILVHFGFNEIISDLLWLTYIQHSWDCYKAKLCYQDWGYRVLDQASQLAPRFKALYVWGATGLSIMLDDDYGAKVIFDRGLEQYPKDWVLNYRAGYHYMIELEDNKTAARLLNVSSENGAPFWTKSLAARLYERSGEFESSRQLIQSMIASSTDDSWKAKLQERLAKLENKRIQKDKK